MSNTVQIKKIYQTFLSELSSFKLQYISDIHLEHRNTFPIIPPVGNYLALLGDIGNPFKKNYIDFINYTSKNWDKIFLISGNHEYWQERYTISEVDKEIENIVSKFDNVYFLNKKSHYNNGYLFVGTTLWSKIYTKSSKNTMGDDLYIKLIN